MANDLIERPHGAYLSVPQRDDRADVILRMCKNNSYRQFGTLMMETVPSEDQREVLVRRRAELVASLTHDRKMIGESVGEMLLGYAKYREMEAKEFRSTITHFVREFGLPPAVPTWAVWKACSDIRMGTAEDIDLAFPPSTMALRRLCDSYAWAVRGELCVLNDVLAGRKASPPISAADHERIKLGLRALADELAAANAARDAPDIAPSLTAEDLKAMVGEDAWDAIPSAPVRAGKRAVPDLQVSGR